MNPPEVQGGAGANAAPALCFRGVTFHYRLDGPLALDAVDLIVERGQLVALVGGNGSGKSTLARLANGLLRPAGGEVVVDGLSTSDPRHAWEVRARVGLLFQDPEDQIVGASVEDDVAFGLENLAVPREEMRRRVASVLRTVGLEGEQATAPHLLSGGQKQRLALAGVLVLRPSILVLDEPTSMLDAAGREDVLGFVRRLITSGVAVVLITQSMDEVLEAERVVALDGGRLVFDGASRDFFRSGRHRGLPVGRPSALALAESLAEGGFTSVAAGAPGWWPLTEDELVSALATRIAGGQRR